MRLRKAKIMTVNPDHQEQGRQHSRRSLLRMTGAAAGGLVLSGGLAQPALAQGTLISATEISGQAAARAAAAAALPTVTDVQPHGTPLAGGAKIRVRGTFNAPTSVTIDGITVPITAAPTLPLSQGFDITTPPHAAGTVNLRVTDAGGTSAVSSVAFVSYYPLPVITQLSVTSGPTGGGNVVTAAGWLHTAPKVTVDGVVATAYGFWAVGSPPSIPDRWSFVMPSHAAGTVDIRVTDQGGTSEIAEVDKYTYVDTTGS